MKHRAKTYRQFINEAYIDDSGELQDFDGPRGDELEFKLIDQAQIIQEYLEESGAERVRLKMDDGVIEFDFKYLGSNYSMKIDLDTDDALISTGNIDIYNDSANSLFDLLAANGLEFLNY